MAIETWKFGDGNKELEMERPVKKKTSIDNEISEPIEKSSREE
jgi:hypothetical protein